MLPKISASVDFLECGKGRKAIITSLDKAEEGFEAAKDKAGDASRQLRTRPETLRTRSEML